jgi:hypothetical protein
MDIQCINLPRFAYQFCKGDNVTPGSTTIIEYTKSALYAHLPQDVYAGQVKILKREDQGHKSEMEIGHWFIHDGFLLPF